MENSSNIETSQTMHFKDWNYNFSNNQYFLWNFYREKNSLIKKKQASYANFFGAIINFFSTFKNIYATLQIIWEQCSNSENLVSI